MKRIIALFTAIVLTVSVFAIGVSAATKADLLTEAAKSPVYKYVKVAFENAARAVEITDEEADQLLPVVKKAVAAISKDNEYGHGGYVSAEHGRVYTLEEYNAVMSCIDEACGILGYTYKMTPASDPKHVGDIVFMVYDEDGKLVFQYDGDVVANTDAATETDTTALFAGAAVLLLAGAAMIAVSKKRLRAE